MNTSSCKAFFFTWGYFCSIIHGSRIKTADVLAPPFPASRAGCEWPMAWHATGRLAWPPTHLDKWGVCVRSMVSIGEHLWPLGCGDRGQWWPRGSRRALAHATKARHRLRSQPCTHSHPCTLRDGETRACTQHLILKKKNLDWRKLKPDNPKAWKSF